MLETKLQEFFGYGKFRAGQEKVILALMRGESAAAIFPTGGGKSICYQLPGLLLDGLTIVVSPLIALMKDQVDTMKNKNFDVDCLGSFLSFEERREVQIRLQKGVEETFPKKIVALSPIFIKMYSKNFKFNFSSEPEIPNISF